MVCIKTYIGGYPRLGKTWNWFIYIYNRYVSMYNHIATIYKMYRTLLHSHGMSTLLKRYRDKATVPGRYQFQKLLGSGSYGLVLRAFHTDVLASGVETRRGGILPRCH